MYLYIDKIENLNIKKPIKVTIVEKDGEYVASIDSLKQYAYGYNIEEVIEELKLGIVTVYKKFQNENINLSKNAENLKKEFYKFIY